MNLPVEMNYKAVVMNPDTARWNTIIENVTYERAKIAAKEYWTHVPYSYTQVWHTNPDTGTYIVVHTFDL